MLVTIQLGDSSPYPNIFKPIHLSPFHLSNAICRSEGNFAITATPSKPATQALFIFAFHLRHAPAINNKYFKGKIATLCCSPVETIIFSAASSLHSQFLYSLCTILTIDCSSHKLYLLQFDFRYVITFLF